MKTFKMSIACFTRVLLVHGLTCGLAAEVRAAEHPSLYFTDSQISALRARAAQSDAGADPFYTDLYEEIKIDCRSTYGPSKTIPDSTPKRNAQAILSHGAMLLLDPTGRAIHPNYQSSTRFFGYYNAVLNWPGWNNFMGNDPFDTTDFLIALCIGYDWHFDAFSEAQRTDIVNKLAARADYLVDHADIFFDIPAELDDPDHGYLNTFKVLRNRDKIPLGALGMVAYTLEGEVPNNRRQRWLDTLNARLSVWDAHVSHDGMSHEGYAYHEYMLQSLLPMLAVRSYKTGVNQFTLFPYIHKHPIYSVYSWIPGGDRSFIAPIPFGDCGTEPPSDMRTLSALAARWLKNDPDQLDRLANWMQYRGPSLASNVPNNSYSRVGPLQFFWADDSIPMLSPTQLNLPLFHYYPERGGFVWRSGWDNMAMYFAMTCGPTIGGHQQPEMGNFAIYKGGAPFIGHHGYSTWRRTEHYNVMLVNNLGQYGEQDSGGSATTEPQPANRWAAITLAVGDNDYFNVMTNLQPIYRASGLAVNTREFVGFGERIFVRDRVRMSGSTSVKFDDLLHSFATLHPSLPPTESTALNIDSAPSVNSWSGSGPAWTLTPRSAGPFTASMTARDLSSFAWPGTIAVSRVKNENGSFTNRGYKLNRSKTINSGSSLMGFYFPQAGESIAPWPNPSQAEGFRITRGGSVRAVTAWAESSLSNANGLTLTGAMGGLDLDQTSFWGRDATTLAYEGVNYLQSTLPVSFFAKTGGATGRIRVHCNSSATIQIHHPQIVGSVTRDQVEIPFYEWNWSGGILTLTVPALPAGATYETAEAAKNAVEVDRWNKLR